MRKLRDILFIAITSAGLLCTIAWVGLGAIAPEMARPESSSLEHRDYQTLEGVLGLSFASGEAQDAFEQYVADSVPGRDDILLFNAALQRQGIATAATLVGYPTYPTFFGSNENEVTELGYLIPCASKTPSPKSTALNGWVNTLNAAAKAHPECRFTMRAVLETHQSEANPTYDLISGNKVDSNWVQANIIDRLDPSLHASVDPIASPEEIRDMWLRTDPHWTLQRALVTYNSVASDMGLRTVEYDHPVKVIDRWYGTAARKGLDLRYPSALYDLPISFSHLKYYQIKNDAQRKKARPDPGLRAEALESKNKKAEVENVHQGYSAYFGAFNGLIVNSGKNNGRKCLLIGDSFTHCLKRYIAMNYAETYSILPGNYATARTLNDYIEQYGIDDVIVITQALKYGPMGFKSPQFLGLDESQASAVQDEGDDIEL